MSGVFHDGVGKSSLYKQGTSIQDTVALYIEKIHQLFASCVMVHSQTQAQNLGVFSYTLRPVTAWLVLDPPVGLEFKRDVLTHCECISVKNTGSLFVF